MQIACGFDHTLVLTKNCLFGFGSSYFGQLGDLVSDQKSKCQFGPLDLSPLFPNEKVRRISCGEYNNLICTEENIYIFGDNRIGQLGCQG